MSNLKTKLPKFTELNELAAITVSLTYLVFKLKTVAPIGSSGFRRALCLFLVVVR